MFFFVFSSFPACELAVLFRLARSEQNSPPNLVFCCVKAIPQAQAAPSIFLEAGRREKEEPIGSAFREHGAIHHD